MKTRSARRDFAPFIIELETAEEVLNLIYIMEFFCNRTIAQKLDHQLAATIAKAANEHYKVQEKH